LAALERMSTAYRDFFLKDCRGCSPPPEIFRQIRDICFRKQRGINGRADLEGHTGCEDQVERPRYPGGRPPDARNEIAAIVKRSLHIEADPIDESQHTRQSVRVDPRSMEPNTITQSPHVAHCAGEARLRGRFPPAENNSLKEALARRQKIHHIQPGQRFLATERTQVRVVTVGTPPRTALQKNNRRKKSRKVDRGEWLEPPDEQRGSANRRRGISGHRFQIGQQPGKCRPHACNGRKAPARLSKEEKAEKVPKY